MELVYAVVGPVVNVLTGHIKQKLGYLTSSTEHVEHMKNRMQYLEGQSADIECHMKENELNNRKIPARVPGWLEEVKKIKEDVGNIPSNNIGCFIVKEKFLAGRNALRLTKVIERLIRDGSDIIWRDAQIPLGRVDSKGLASTSGGGTQNLLKSRDKTFNDALKLLQQNDDDAARVIALCEMGGVGKTTLMNQLKEAAEDNKMFNWIVVVTVGKSSNLFAIQNAIAEHTGEPLTKTDEIPRATYLSKRFNVFLERKEKILVILDDVWDKIRLEDMGLASPLSNGVKLLLRSRDENICQQIAVDAGSVLKVVKVDVLEEEVLEEEEARDLFSRISGISVEHDRDLYEIGCEIVKKCGCLPLAIKLIAATLKCQNKFVWRYTLKHLKKNDLDTNVQKIIKISYENLKWEEDKAIFLLCGMFPEDSNIPIEDLTRYAWGLKLLEQVSTMEAARDSIETSVSNLKNSYLLMDGDSHHSDFVKLHDLVLEFVVNTVSKGGGWIIHHEDDFSNWSGANDMSRSCKQISLACKGMSEFPNGFKFPNLTVLKLMQGDESLRFPQDFYVGMEKLQVIAFEKLKYPLVPTSFQFSSNLRTLCLKECLLMFDLTCIGNLLNLEVLSFANSGVTILPSTFGNLKKLRLLDVTGCYNLVIDDGVLKSLVKLEELYMIPYDEKACCFTDNNSREFAERSENLRALEFEFIGDNAHMKNMSYENLKRFKLSVGCSFTEVREHVQTYKVDMHSYENSLKLVTNREELLKSKINELFKITDALYLQVNDMNTLEDVVVDPPHPQNPPQNSSFYNLRLLVVSQCAKLKYLFTPSVATNLSNLEYLVISRCPNMEAVIHIENEGLDIIMFSILKYLRLAELPKLLHLCNNVDVIELPRLMELQLEGLPKFTSIYPDSATSFVSSNISPTQSFLNKEDATPKLEKLFVKDCDSIEVLFNMDFGEIEQFSSGLRSIKVDGCNSLVKLFSCNPFPFFNNLQELDVRRCRSMQVLFEIDSGRAGRYEEQDATPKLEKLFVSDMENLKEIWPPQFSSSKLRLLRELMVEGCDSIKVLFNMDFGEIKQLSWLRSIQVKRCDSLVKLFSCNPFPYFNNLQELTVRRCRSIQVLFDIDSRRTGNIGEQVCNSSLRSIVVEECDSLVNLLPRNPMPLFNHLEELEVRRCRSIQVLFDIDSGRAGNIGEQVCTSSLRSIVVWGCDSLVNLFPRNPMPLFNHLEELRVTQCASIEVIFNIDMRCVGETDKVSSSRLRSIRLWGLGKLREVWRIKDAGNNLIHGFEAVESIFIRDCERFENFITPATKIDLRALKEVEIGGCGRERERSYELDECNQDQEALEIINCKSMTEVFETQEINEKSGTDTGKSFPRLEYITMLKLPKLKILKIQGCDLLEHIFTFSTLESLMQLEELEVKDCKAMEIIVTEEIGEQTTASDVVVFPHLKSLMLVNLPNFVGFFLGKNEFIWPALEKVVISECPQITVFTYGRSTAPKLNFINTSLGKHSVECGLNFLVTTTSHQARLPSDESTSSYRPTTMERLPWSYHNLIEVDMDYNPSGGHYFFIQ